MAKPTPAATKPKRKPSPDAIREIFFNHGTQYYVTGRMAVFAHANPVCPNVLLLNPPAASCLSSEWR